MFSRKTCCLLFLSLSLPILISNSTTANFFLVPRGRESRIGKKRFIAISVLVRSNQNHPKKNTEKSNINVEMPFFSSKNISGANLWSFQSVSPEQRLLSVFADFARVVFCVCEWPLRSLQISVIFPFFSQNTFSNFWIDEYYAIFGKKR